MAREFRVRLDLQPRALLSAYAAGLFPMPDPDRPERLGWFSPELRGLLPLDERFHVSRRLRQTIRSGRFVCTIDAAFERVMLACGQRPEGSWITDDFLDAYRLLHHLGVAHSVEAWPREQVKIILGRPVVPEHQTPVGGVYGVAIGGAFFAESMFHTATDAGKVALVGLVERLRRQGFGLCDVQWTTDNLKRFGAYDLPREDYLCELATQLGRRVRFA